MILKNFFDAETNKVESQIRSFPSSRYMGSKQAILPFLYEVLHEIKFKTALDAFSGSAAVSYLLKSMGKSVTCNDFLSFCFHTAQSLIVNSYEKLSREEVERLLLPFPNPDLFITETFRGLYFNDEENLLLDNLTANIRQMESSYKQSIAYASLTRACLRRRARGIFTYTGLKYDDGRRDLKISLADHFKNAVNLINAAVFNNGCQHQAFNLDVFDIPQHYSFDLVYIDTPYVSPYSDNDYTRRYHFIEGLTRYWQGLEILHHTVTKKFKRIPSLFDSEKTVYDGFSKLFNKFQDSIIVVSYSSNGIPSHTELIDLLGQYKKKVTMYETNHRYSFGTHGHKVGNDQNKVKEYLFVGR